MKIIKKISNQNHQIDFLNKIQLSTYLKKNFTSMDIMIIDKNLSNNQLVKYYIKNYKNRCLLIKGHEKIKTLENFSKISEKIIRAGIQRKSKIFSFGGGTIGDLSGFIASTLLRGIGHVMIPTSLLAMVDSSIGGKTGVNSKLGKNLIGTFYLPANVIICKDFLKSLPAREISCGFAEIIKYAFIQAKELKKLLIKSKNLDRDIDKIIKISIETKLKFIVDFQEKSEGKSARAILNFGHTVGHAIENSYSYGSMIKHGEAIAIGMIVEYSLSNLLGHNNESIDTLKFLLNKYNLPTNYKKFVNGRTIPKLIKKMMLDKKASDDYVNLISIKKDNGFINKISFKNLNKFLFKIN